MRREFYDKKRKKLENLTFNFSLIWFTWALISVAGAANRLDKQDVSFFSTKVLLAVGETSGNFGMASGLVMSSPLEADSEFETWTDTELGVATLVLSITVSLAIDALPTDVILCGVAKTAWDIGTVAALVVTTVGEFCRKDDAGCWLWYLALCFWRCSM